MLGLIRGVNIRYNFKEYNRDQMYMMPPSLRDWLPSGDIVWFILDAVKQMDLNSFYERYREDGRGSWAYEPSMMVWLFLYGYCVGERSSRKLERLCERDIGFRVLMANQAPDHSSISRFRKENGKALEELFVEVLRLCSEAGLLKVGTVALDGTKIEANASLCSNRTREHIEKEVKRMFSEAEAKDKEEDELYGEDKRGDELPEDLANPKSRLERLKACKARLCAKEAEAREEQQKKIDKRQADEEARGKKKRGRKPKAPEQINMNEKKANVTDPESRIMKTRKGYIQGYNGQAVVDENQVIVAADLTCDENDKKQLHPMLNQAEENLDALHVGEKIGNLAADAGYLSEENLEAEKESGPTLHISTKKDHKQRQDVLDRPEVEGPMPAGLSVQQRMEWRLSTKEGKEIYKKRAPLSEGVFGQIKSVRGIRRFMQQGLKACRSEWKLICATHNLLKLYVSGKACWT